MYDSWWSYTWPLAFHICEFLELIKVYPNYIRFETIRYHLQTIKPFWYSIMSQSTFNALITREQKKKMSSKV